VQLHLTGSRNCTSSYLIALYCGLLRFFLTKLHPWLALLCWLCHSLSEMLTALKDALPELRALIAALTVRKSVLQLKVRLLKGLKAELQAAKDSGLTWLMIWEAMRDAGYPGSYPNFCRAAKALMQSDGPQPKSKNENLASPRGGKGNRLSAASTQTQSNKQEEKPEWQRQREETMAKLDHEAEQNREREMRLSRPKVFNPPPFVGRGE